ncbi:hypothetical protein COLO4_22421 [Corchorus olitorius]|uniref:Uncharacterized protein n=1 Tax=Corchorus olitorius TaxID=93759 RepID=A0A1R3ILX1_9ROSI|nr:hypothetical protein COLO4_22421 [Corchorus olitorius]
MGLYDSPLTPSSEHTVFFSKRRKNSSLCAHYTAP